MPSTRQLIRELSKGYINEHCPEESDYFEGIWELVPEDLPSREPSTPSKVGARFAEKLLADPWVASLVIPMVTAALYDLGIYVGERLVGLTKERRLRARLQKRWSAKLKDPQLVSRVMEYVYANLDSVIEAASQKSQ